MEAGYGLSAGRIRNEKHEFVHSHRTHDQTTEHGCFLVWHSVCWTGVLSLCCNAHHTSVQQHYCPAHLREEEGAGRPPDCA